MLAILVDGQQVGMSADSRLERMSDRALLLIAVLAAAIPVAIAVIYPATDPDNAKLIAMYAMALGGFFGIVKGIMVFDREHGYGKSSVRVLLGPIVVVGLVSATVVSFASLPAPFGIAMAVAYVFLPFGLAAGGSALMSLVLNKVSRLIALPRG